MATPQRKGEEILMANLETARCYRGPLFVPFCEVLIGKKMASPDILLAVEPSPCSERWKEIATRGGKMKPAREGEHDR
jgi:hypothetical protein